MIWDTSIWRPEGWNPSRTHSAQKFKIYYQGTLLHHCRKISQYGARRAVLLRRNDLQDQGKSVQSGTPAKGGVPHRRPSLLRAVRSWVLPMSPVQSVTHVSGSDPPELLVEPMGFEPTTSSMPSRRAPNCATAPPKDIFDSTTRLMKKPAQSGAPLG